MHDQMRRLLDRAWQGLGRPEETVLHATRRDVEVDQRLSRLEREQREIAARLELLELQGMPRGGISV